MRYSLLLHNAEPAEGEVPEEAIAAMQEAFAAYGRALESAGVLVAAEVLGLPADDGRSPRISAATRPPVWASTSSRSRSTVPSI
jgi:hypothetical protein